jgi:hypothetical protein
VNDAYTVNFWNAGLPMLIIAALAVLLPGLFAPKLNTSQRSLAWAIFKTAVICYAVGAVISAILYASINNGTWTEFLQDPIGRSNFYLSRSIWFSILWLPILLFVWLIRAQRVEATKGLLMQNADAGDRT